MQITGVLNTRDFTERLSRAARHAARSGEALAFLAIEIDGFDRYTDAFGVPDGIKALAAVGTAIRAAAFRVEDVCGRVGGNRFALVLSGVDTPGMLGVAERARSSVAALNIRHAPGALDPMLTVRIGIASNMGDRSVSTTDLIARAEEALDLAKCSGSNCSVSPSRNESPQRQAEHHRRLVIASKSESTA